MGSKHQVLEALRTHLQPAALIQSFRKRKARLSRGIDRVDADAFERRLSIEIGIASRKALSGRFKFSPYVEMLVSKGRGKAPRIIARPTIRDKLILWALKDALHETLLDDVPRRLPNQVIRILLSELQSKPGGEIIKLDIQSFYDRIPHSKLISRARSRVGESLVLDLIIGAISGAVVPESYHKCDYKKYVVTRGVPQGLPISNFLAHLYLSNFDKHVSDIFPSYFRYVDDIIVISSADCESHVEKKLSKKLNGIGLRINRKKTVTLAYADQFTYLGYEIQNGQAKPRRESVEKFVRSIAAMFSNLRRKKFLGRRSEGWTDEEAGRVFIEELNEKITGAISQRKQYGWVFYFNESTDLSVFNRVDQIVKSMARRSAHLTNAMRSSIKSTVRTYYESKYNKAGGYILNYDVHETYQSKVNFLLKLKYLDSREGAALPPEKVEQMYYQRIVERLSRLEKDVGLIS
jgi:RNA-directed DNA polymerase